MATTENFYTGNTSTTTFGYTFPILQNSDLKVELDGVLKTENTSGTNNDYSISGTNVVFNSAPGQDVDIHIYRQTNVDSAKAVFAAGSSIRAGDLNNNVDQSLYANQEQQQKIRTADVRDNAVTTVKIKDLNVIRSKIANDAIDGTKIADDSINSEHYVADSIDTEHYAPGSVDNTALGADCVTGAKIADDQINSEHYIAGSIDHEHLANDIIDGDNIQDDVINSEHYVAGSIDHEHLSNDCVDGDNIQDNSINSEHYVDGSIDHVHLANDIIDGDNIQDDVINSEHYVAGSIDHEHLSNDCVDEDNIQDDAVRSEHIQANAVTDSEIATGTLDNRYYTESELNGGQLNSLYFTEAEITGGAADGRYYTETELDGGQLDNRYFTETELTGGALDGRYYTETEAEAKFLRQDSSETIASGVTWSSSDAFVATTAAIDARVIELVDNVGGFVPIANETSFPTANPDINTSNSEKGGTIVSVKAASTNLTAQSGTTLTIANGRGTGNAVIITGVSATIPQGFGFLVETTATDHTYAFHRLVPKATEVTTVATNAVNIAAAGANVVDINNFADVYQISQNAPTQRADSSSLQVGDLWFDSSSNKVMMVYDGSSGDGFSAITPNQATLTNINIVAGQVTFQEDLGNITDAINTGSGNNSVNTVGANIASVNTAATNIAKITTVADDLNESTSEIDTVATNITNVNNVGNNISNVNAVHNNATNINAAVANASNINSAVSNASNINAAVSNASNITAVAGNNSNITTVAGSITNVNTAATNIASINTAASNISNVNNFTDRYQIASSNPSTDGGGNALAEGDLYFNTTSDELRIYNGSTWQGGVTATGNLAGLGSNTFTGNQTVNANIIVSGTVDGVDIAAFKTAFDNLSTDIVNDTTPQLGGALDGQNNNMSNIGTIDGANLQLDFGTL